MKRAALLGRLADLVATPYDRRWSFAITACYGLTQCARIVSTLAPAGAIEDYIHTVMHGERALARWKLAYTTGGGYMPTLFMLAGWYLFEFHNPWWIVGAQVVWFLLWGFIGLPWLYCTLDEQKLVLQANALTAMCQTTDPSQEQLDTAARLLQSEIKDYIQTVQRPPDDR
jgi:hypothetical protein